MSVMFAKIASRIYPIAHTDSVLAPRLPLFLWQLRKDFFTAIFLICAVLMAAVYVVEANRIMSGGRRVSLLRAGLKNIEDQEREAGVQLAKLYTPRKIKEEAVGSGFMVEVSEIKYVQEHEAVAARTKTAP